MRWRLGLAIACWLVCVAGIALTATNTVASSRLGDTRRGVTANDLKPPQCAALDLSSVVAGSGTVDGTRENELVVGGPGDDRLRGRGGDDCLLGGGGDDRLQGNGGADVCIGGPGNDSYASCEVVFP